MTRGRPRARHGLAAGPAGAGTRRGTTGRVREMPSARRPSAVRRLLLAWAMTGSSRQRLVAAAGGCRPTGAGSAGSAGGRARATTRSTSPRPGRSWRCVWRSGCRWHAAVAAAAASLDGSHRRGPATASPVCSSSARTRRRRGAPPRRTRRSPRSPGPPAAPPAPAPRSPVPRAPRHPRARAALTDVAEARAQRAAVLITAPLGLCFLPAFLVLGVAPVVIGLADDVLPRW